ncbi:MAG: hypothetical protein HYZ28_17525 [Myxococcales bacterium]|nr:hypothetical protein [Myxococcales bacterium]
MRKTALLCAAVAFTGCASHVLIPPDQQANIERDFGGKDRDRFLKLAFFVTPFFGDASKRLLSPVPPEHLRLLNHPDGTPVNPGAAEKVLPPGKRVRILKVELPSAWVMAERVLYTPRTQPWIHLAAENEPREVPLVIVLRPQIKTEQEFRAEIERYLSADDPSARIESWPEPVKDAVRTKKALVDMPAEALEMAWGYPQKKRIDYEESVRKEEWTYAEGKRVAYLSDGRVVKLQE